MKSFAGSIHSFMHRMDGGTASSEVEEETDQEDIEAGKRAN